MFSEQIFAVARIADQGVLYLLLLLSVISLGLILERLFALGKIASASQRMRMKVKAALDSHSLEDVKVLSKDTDSIEAQALAVGLRHIKDNGDRGLEDLFNSFSLAARPDLERSLSFLATLGSNAPYIGLFGTVLGIMKAFNDLARSTEAGQQTVMAGISVALVATAAGLFVAIPAVIAYNYFQRQVKGILQGLESVKALCLAYSKQVVKKD